jgi:peroxiredoxin Q/BCP
MGPLPNKRRTFVVATDRRVLAVITSESNMRKHADGALKTLQELR